MTSVLEEIASHDATAVGVPPALGTIALGTIALGAIALVTVVQCAVVALREAATLAVEPRDVPLKFDGPDGPRDIDGAPPGPPPPTWALMPTPPPRPIPPPPPPPPP